MMIFFYIGFVCFSPILYLLFPATNFGAGLPDLSISRVLSLLLVAFYFLEIFITKRIKKLDTWNYFVIVYTIVAIASVAWSPYRYTPGTINYLFEKVVLLALVSMIAVSLFKNGQYVKAYVICMSINGAVLGLITISQMVYSPFMQLLIGGQSTIIERATGIFANPNQMAIYLVFIIPCALFCLEKKYFPKYVGIAIPIILLGGIICTVSRKGILTGVLAVFLYYTLKKKLTHILLLGIVVIIAGMVISQTEPVKRRIEQEAVVASLEHRMNLVSAGLQMFMSSPLYGLGHLGYRDNYSLYFRPKGGKDQQAAHNMYIRILANMGLLGIIPFLGIFLYPLYRAFKVIKTYWKDQNNQDMIEYASFCVASAVPYMINGWFAGATFTDAVIVLLLYSQISIFLSAKPKEQHGAIPVEAVQYQAT